jgi:sulfur carrier protein
MRREAPTRDRTLSRKACGFFMTVTVNGKPMELPDGLSIEELLVRLEIRREFTAVALNREVAQRSRTAETRLSEGDKVEIVHPMGGG